MGIGFINNKVMGTREQFQENDNGAETKWELRQWELSVDSNRTGVIHYVYIQL